MARPRTAGRPVRPVLLWASLAAAIPVIAVEMALLPNLRENPGFLALVVVTTVLALGSVGLSASGLRSQLPVPARLVASVALWGLVAVDLVVFLVGPLVAARQTAHESPVQYASAPAAASPAATAAAAAAAQPTAAPAASILSGAFDARPGPDSVSGKATLGKTPDGRVVLSLAGLDATPGPDLYVYLSTVDSPGADAQVKAGIEVGKLKATKGDLNYELDAKSDYAQYKSVVVYCKSFSVVFGYANLK